jgi:SlyX protein
MNAGGSGPSRADSSLVARVDELETRLAFLDDTLFALNEVVAAHDRHLLQAVDEMQRLRSDLQALRGALSPDPRDEPPPPHY